MRRAVAILACCGLAGCHWLFAYNPAGDPSLDRPRFDGPGPDRPRLDRPRLDGDGPIVDRLRADRRDGKANLFDKPAGIVDKKPDAPALICKDAASPTWPSTSPTSLTSAQAAFNTAGCVSSGEFCQVTQVRVYTLPACFISTPTVNDVLPYVLDPADMDPMWWTALTPTAVASAFFFGSMSSQGPALLAAVNTCGGGTTPSGMYMEDSSIPCLNCTTIAYALVLLYPSSKKVVRLDGVRTHD